MKAIRQDNFQEEVDNFWIYKLMKAQFYSKHLEMAATIEEGKGATTDRHKLYQ